MDSATLATIATPAQDDVEVWKQVIGKWQSTRQVKAQSAQVQDQPRRRLVLLDTEDAEQDLANIKQLFAASLGIDNVGHLRFRQTMKNFINNTMQVVSGGKLANQNMIWGRMIKATA